MLHFPRWRLGLVYHSPVLGTLVQTNSSSGLFAGPDPPTRRQEQSLRFPTSVGIGASWRPRLHWTVAADATWDEWREWTVDVPGQGQLNIFDGRLPGETSTRNTVNVNLGSEWILRRQGHFVPRRLGLYNEPPGMRDPVLFTGYALKLISLGAGYNSNRFKFDGAIQLGWFEHRVTEAVALETIRLRSIDPFAYDAVGQRRELTWRVKLSAILRITDTDELKRTLGGIFGGGP
jgi:hypothetical protein